MRCTRSESTEIPWCEPIIGVPALLANGHAHSILYVRTSAGSSGMRNRTRNDKYRFYPQTIAEILAGRHFGLFWREAKNSLNCSRHHKREHRTRKISS